MTSFTSTVNKQGDGICVISIEGYLDAHTASDLESTMQGVLADGCRRIVVDFSHLDYISSAGLGVFMVFIESVRKDGGDIKLASMKDKVFSVFDLLGFPVLFEIFPLVSEAVEAFPASA
ncbi:MAG: STAS domain-containing protein [Ignavibacteria bacterium]|nr:STAS domain-containing protein [Ignavibacteria bacterium]